jgi:glycosyltransferase involved in cell wall biosynthesis
LETTQELRRLGWDVTLINAGPKDQKEINRVVVTNIPKKNIYFIRQIIFHFQVLKLIFQSWNSIDVILFHQMSAPWLLPLRTVRKILGRQRPLIVMDTRTLPMISRENARLKDRIRNGFDGLMNILANHLADGQTAITGRMAEVKKIPQDQLLGIWPSGVDLEEFQPAQSLREWDSITREVRLIYVGVLHIQRKLMAMCQAVEAANSSGKNFVFTLVGWGTEKEKLIEYAQHTNGRIRVLPAVPHNQVPGLLAQAHVGVLPFPDQERFRVSSPIKLFEYMASGLPILATKIVCHTDVVKNGKFAFWSNDVSQEAHAIALDQLWECRYQLPELGNQAVEEAINWTWQAAAMKLDIALRSALVPPPKKAESQK